MLFTYRKPLFSLPAGVSVPAPTKVDRKHGEEFSRATASALGTTHKPRILPGRRPQRDAGDSGILPRIKANNT